MAGSENKSLVAIVGMSCRFAGCADLRSYWQRILTGTPAFSDYDDPEAYHYLHADSESFRRVTTLRAGYLHELWQANQSSVEITAAITGNNPENGLASDLAAQALRDSECGTRPVPRDRTGIIVGYAPQFDPASVAWVQHGLVTDQTLDIIRRCFPHGASRQFEELRTSLDASLPAYDSRNISALFPHSLISQISEHFDISGPSYCVNGAATSGHIAIQSACDELLADRADFMLAGAVQGLLSPQYMMPFSRMGILSKSDVMHPFGQDADGALLGEGGGMLALKRHEDALRDGNRIYALVRSVGIASEGSRKKSGEALTLAIKRSFGQKATPGDSVALIEAHGSAIPQEDRLEIKSMLSLYAGEKIPKQGSIAIGTVKALVGHCGTAAGIAGAIKAALALYHRILPPAQEALRPNARLRLHETPFYLNLSPRPWVHNDAGEPRRAGVSAIATEGLAAHAILEQSQGDL